MQVIDEINGNLIDKEDSINVLVDFVNNTAIYGYVCQFIDNRTLLPLIIYDKDNSVTLVNALRDITSKKVLRFSKYHGYYYIEDNMPTHLKIKFENELGHGNIPYFWGKNYEARKLLSLFTNSCKWPKQTSHIKTQLKYTFGLEFETESGYIPEDKCLDNGLIALYDGSIKGMEYSTIVLEGNKGLSLLNKQLSLLKEYTAYNKDCALHVHLGGFPQNKDKIFRLYTLCYRLEDQILNLCPKMTFETYKYKRNGKDYCQHLNYYDTFDDIYYYFVRERWFGSFDQPHPNDITREHKWNIYSRYTWLNLVNLLCYDSNKTVEFRFLRPTYNYNKIVLWLYILNAILLFAESDEDTTLSLDSIITLMYKPSLAEKIKEGMIKLSILSKWQENNDDFIGALQYREEQLFKDFIIK